MVTPAPARPQSPPNPLPDGPRGFQEGPYIALEGPKTRQHTSKTAQNGSENGSESAPGAVRMASKRAPHGPR
eukprot:1353373-Pyramimonas_sp.AAC.1